MSTPRPSPAESRRFVVLPGMEGSGSTQTRLVDALRVHGEVIALSYPSDRVVSYEGLLQELPWPEAPFVLVASSYGGPLALRVALKFPERVQALVLLGSFAASPIPFGRALSAFIPVALRRPPHRRGLSKTLGPDVDEALVDIAYEAVRQGRPDVMQARLREVLHGDLRPLLRSLPQPLLYVRGAHDRLVGRRGMNSVRSAPRVQTRTLNTGHFMALTAPEECAREIVAFLRFHD